ncbi:hypothetical protein BJF83_20905 [Nocardiopsis sp. CNR-923]|uniref:hypothetical protein n=1 Tax=Nocardiopsis sp. CNR-923 TaxID=1904965 RepID=UPI000967871F|nr:hypothetical protein [Nocardiopsis sp. CNR-923]OLT26547.1 hypothetical protein BJF83_20905 [Nocardiopsis sp. CNR-923]
MQAIPGPGPRNPTGATPGEVVDAIHAATGAVWWSWRYELLDRDDRKLRDLDDEEVDAASGVVTLNNLADEVQRTLTVRMRADARVDWLTNRIMPWARLHLPPYGPDRYVEWPQGVFLPVTPKRTVDSARTVWRDVEGLDKSTILAEDQAPTRYSTAGHLDAHDRFLRATTGGWGTPDQGAEWLVATTLPATYETVPGGGGHASITVPSSIDFPRIVYQDRRYRDGEVRVQVSVGQVTSGSSLLPSVVMRRRSDRDYYRVRLHFTSAQTVALSAANSNVQIGEVETTPVTYTPGRWINVRARLIGQDIMARIWPEGTPEPAGWHLERTVETATLTEGEWGLSGSGFSGNTNTSPTMMYARWEFNANPTGRVTSHVQRVLEASGITRHAITPHEEVLPGIREWEPGTSRLTVVNDLLASIGYRSLSFDEWGVAIAVPYVSPSARAPEFWYRDDDRSIMVAEATQERDLHGVPNQWVLSTTDGTDDPRTVTYTNRSPHSPTSTVRRGRIITDYRTENEASSESALIEQVARLAYESTQLYEAIEFTTALNPLHSFDDVFGIRRDDLSLDTVFSGHTWELPLTADGLMRHRARRVVSMPATEDPGIVVGDATVVGAIEAGNMRTGTTQVTPTPHVPTVVRVSGLNLVGTGSVRVQVCANSLVPGSTLKEVAVRNPSPDGFDLWLTRATATRTSVYWLAIRGA